jgi:hypothetical protein
MQEICMSGSELRVAVERVGALARLRPAVDEL